MSRKTRRVGILTGGGDCPGLNAVIRAAVHRLVREHDIEVVGSEDAFNGFLDDPQRLHDLGLDDVSGLLQRGGTILGTTNRGDPFAYPSVNSAGEHVLVDRSEELAQRVRDAGLDGLICIGGDGTLGISHRLMAERDIPVVGVPKTIDNDVGATDLTFGFWTAVQRATDALDALTTTAESHDRIMVVELMGRDAGFLTLAAGVAGGADVILLPELPFDLEIVAHKIKRRKNYQRRYSLIAVAEGAYEQGGDVVTEKLHGAKAMGRLRKLGGVGKHVADRLGDMLDMETRVTVLGHLQRGGTPVAFDRVLSTSYGVAAAPAAAEGDWGQMASLRGGDVVRVPLEWAVGGKPRRVTEKHPWMLAARATGICFGDELSGPSELTIDELSLSDLGLPADALNKERVG